MLGILQDTLKLTRFVSAQPRYNLLFREVERELFPLAQVELMAFGREPTGYALNTTTEEGKFMSITSLL